MYFTAVSTKPTVYCIFILLNLAFLYIKLIYTPFVYKKSADIGGRTAISPYFYTVIKTTTK